MGAVPTGERELRLELPDVCDSWQGLDPYQVAFKPQDFNPDRLPIQVNTSPDDRLVGVDFFNRGWSGLGYLRLDRLDFF